MGQFGEREKKKKKKWQRTDTLKSRVPVLTVPLKVKEQQKDKRGLLDCLVARRAASDPEHLVAPSSLSVSLSGPRVKGGSILDLFSGFFFSRAPSPCTAPYGPPGVANTNQYASFGLSVQYSLSHCVMNACPCGCQLP